MLRDMRLSIFDIATESTFSFSARHHLPPELSLILLCGTIGGGFPVKNVTMHRQRKLDKTVRTVASHDCFLRDNIAARLNQGISTRPKLSVSDGN